MTTPFLLAAALFGSPTYTDVQPLLQEYCTHCHGNQARAKGLDLENFPFTSVLRENATSGELLELAIQRMRATSYPMPPGGGMPEEPMALIEAWLAAGMPTE